jgi:hypothetical protein
MKYKKAAIKTAHTLGLNAVSIIDIGEINKNKTLIFFSWERRHTEMMLIQCKRLDLFNNPVGSPTSLAIKQVPQNLRIFRENPQILPFSAEICSISGD